MESQSDHRHTQDTAIGNSEEMVVKDSSPEVKVCKEDNQEKDETQERVQDDPGVLMRRRKVMIRKQQQSLQGLCRRSKLNGARKHRLPINPRRMWLGTQKKWRSKISRLKVIPS
jgi:hypothetical protein